MMFDARTLTSAPFPPPLFLPSSLPSLLPASPAYSSYSANKARRVSNPGRVRVCRFPVENLAQGWDGSATALVICRRRRLSAMRFLLFSESTALSSRAVADSVKSGAGEGGREGGRDAFF